MINGVYWSIVISLSAPIFTGDHTYETYYDIIRNNKVIGYMKCSKLQSRETVEYTNESLAKFSVIVDVSVYNKLQSSFRNGMLHDGKLVRLVNGKTKSDKRIAWDKEVYRTNNDGKTGSFKSKISFSTACLMYTEPLGMKYIFSENFGQYVEVNETIPHKYVFKFPDGNDNVYTYLNGKCIEVEVRTSLATVYIRPRQ